MRTIFLSNSPVSALGHSGSVYRFLPFKPPWVKRWHFFDPAGMVSACMECEEGEGASMAKRKKRRPLFFDIGAWKADWAVTQCDLATRGIWLDLLCVMHEKRTGGEIRGTIEYIASLTRCSPDEALAAIQDLQRTCAANVAKIGNEWLIVNRRMCRKAALNPTIRLRILKRDRYTCRYCGDAADTVDHVIPRSRGGTREDRNLVAACWPCNFKKRARTAKEFIREG